MQTIVLQTLKEKAQSLESGDDFDVNSIGHDSSATIIYSEDGTDKTLKLDSALLTIFFTSIENFKILCQTLKDNDIDPAEAILSLEHLDVDRTTLGDEMFEAFSDVVDNI